MLRRAAGTAVRDLLQTRRPGSTEEMRIALALPARDNVEAGAVALGALLGGYSFGRYRSEPVPGASLTLLALVPSGCRCAATLQRLSGQAAAAGVPIYLVGANGWRT